MYSTCAKYTLRVTRGRSGTPSPEDDRLISGRLRGKAARRGAAAATIAVDGVAYTWTHRHGWLVWGKGIKALSISVSLHPGRTRELILDFTMKVGPEDGPPSDLRVVQALEPAIREAIRAGWDPESRGRAFRYEVADSI